jgi:hypothetical protein
MPIATSIVIVRPEHLVSVRKRLAESELVAVISESELLQLQDNVLAQPPEVLVMHSTFAATSRGASLVSALMAKPRDTGTAVRVFIEDEVEGPLILSQTTLTPTEALLETSRPLDRAGTRQAARYPMNRRAVTINGDAGQLIDLSVSGAQVQSAIRLRPLKVARLLLPDATGDLRLQGTVAWAIAVPSGGSIQYRAGIEFVNPDKKQLAMFCTAFGGAPDPTLGAIDR